MITRLLFISLFSILASGVAYADNNNPDPSSESTTSEQDPDLPKTIQIVV